jgi:hypothetical protein
MHVLALLFTGLLPLLLLLVVEDVFWSAGFLLAYLGVQGCHTNDANDRPVALADDGHGHMTVDRARYCLLCASMVFLWILVLAAVLWYYPDPASPL